MITGRQILEARSLLGLSRSDLATELSILSAPSLKRIEMFDELPLSAHKHAEEIHRALERAGVEFFTGHDGSPGVRLREGEG